YAWTRVVNYIPPIWTSMVRRSTWSRSPGTTDPLTDAPPADMKLAGGAFPCLGRDRSKSTDVQKDRFLREALRLSMYRGMQGSGPPAAATAFPPPANQPPAPPPDPHAGAGRVAPPYRSRSVARSLRSL